MTKFYSTALSSGAFTRWVDNCAPEAKSIIVGLGSVTDLYPSTSLVTYYSSDYFAMADDWIQVGRYLFDAIDDNEAQLRDDRQPEQPRLAATRRETADAI